MVRCRATRGRAQGDAAAEDTSLAAGTETTEGADNIRPSTVQDISPHNASDLHVCQARQHSVQWSLVRDYLD